LYFDYKGLMDTAIGVGELIYEVQLTLTDSQGGITVYQIFFVVPIDESLVDVVVEVTNTTSTTTFN
jgi:imidazoleglycerol phosphate dehydratase HisB